MKNLILMLTMIIAIGVNSFADHQVSQLDTGDQVALSIDQPTDIEAAEFACFETPVPDFGIPIQLFETPGQPPHDVYAIDPAILDAALFQNQPFEQIIYTAGISLPDDMDWRSVLNIVLFVLSAVFGSTLLLVKNKARVLLQLLTKILDAVEDNNVTEAEVKSIAETARKLVQKE